MRSIQLADCDRKLTIARGCRSMLLDLLDYTIEVGIQARPKRRREFLKLGQPNGGKEKEVGRRSKIYGQLRKVSKAFLARKRHQRNDLEFFEH